MKTLIWIALCLLFVACEEHPDQYTEYSVVRLTNGVGDTIYRVKAHYVPGWTNMTWEYVQVQRGFTPYDISTHQEADSICAYVNAQEKQRLSKIFYER